jgi:hypothetical protein
VSFGVSFSSQRPILMSEGTGTDARFPSEFRQIVVIGLSNRPASGAGEVAGSNSVAQTEWS